MRTKPFSPSKISVINDCPLRYLLETESYPSVNLPSNIYALTGTAIHKIIEANLSNPSISGSDLKKQFIELISKLLARNSGAPLISWVFEKYGLSGILSSERTISSVQQIKSLLAKYGEEKNNTKADIEFITKLIEPDVLGSEKWLEYKNLELAGKIDFSYIDNEDIIHVIDFKSGKVIDNEGQPKDGYLLQIGVYGLMVEHSTSNSNILLELIGSHTSWSGRLDDSLKMRVRNLVAYAKKILPLNQEIDASSLSKIGEHCSSCSSRFACSEYGQTLKNRFLGQDDCICSPNDLIGSVSKVTKRDDLVDILVKTNNEIICSIIGLPFHLFQEIKIDDLISAYFLGILDIENRCKFPVNFFIFRDDAPRMSSFESLLFISRPIKK